MRISVIIPTFNRRAEVADAVQSVLSQTDPAAEIIVVDDGSTDGTAVALSESFGGRIEVMVTGQRGVAAARNAGVYASSGDWIAFLDSDDLWLPNKLTAQLEFLLTHPDAEICQTDEIWIRNGRRVNQRHRHRKPSGRIFIDSLQLCLVSPSAVLLRRALFDRVGGFDESLAVCEDYDLWLRIARDTPIWLVDRAMVIKHGGHADQLSGHYWGMDRFRVAAIAKLLDCGGLSPDHELAAREVLRQKCEVLAGGAEKRGREEEAQRYQQLARHYDFPPP